MADRAPVEPVADAARRGTPSMPSRLQFWLAGVAIAVVASLILWPVLRTRLVTFDAAKWKAHDDRPAMVDDVLHMVRRDEIQDQATAEARLGHPDQKKGRASGNGTAWWYDLNTHGRYLRLDFDGTGRLGNHQTGPSDD